MFFKIGSVLFYMGVVLVLVGFVTCCANGLTLATEGVKWFPFRFLHLGLGIGAGIFLGVAGVFMRICGGLGEVARIFE